MAVQQAVAELHIPPTIRVVYGGTYAEQQKSFRDLLGVLVLAIVLRPKTVWTHLRRNAWRGEGARWPAIP